MTSSSWGSRAFVAAGVACAAGAVAGLVVLERRRRQRLALEVLEPDDDDGNDLVGAEAVTRPIIGGTDGDAKAGKGEGKRDGEAGTGGLEAGDEAAGVGPSASPPDDETDDEDDDDDGHAGSADLFLPPLSGEWAHVPDGAVLPAGMDVTMDMTTGGVMARLPIAARLSFPAVQGISEVNGSVFRHTLERSDTVGHLRKAVATWARRVTGVDVDTSMVDLVSSKDNTLLADDDATALEAGLFLHKPHIRVRMTDSQGGGR